MYRTPKTERREQIAEDTTVKREVECQPETILYSKVLETTTSLVETAEDNRVQEDTEGLMGPMEELHKDQEDQEEGRYDQINTQTAK